MGRYTFTAADLVRLQPLLSSPLVRRVLGSTVPVKQFAEPGRHVEHLPLPVAVRGRDDPGGVDLSEILAAAKAVSPAVRSVAVRGNTITVVSDRPPEPPERRELGALLADRDRLTRLKPKPSPPSTADLTRVLLDEATDDQEWQRAFRRYAVTHLIPHEEVQE